MDNSNRASSDGDNVDDLGPGGDYKRTLSESDIHSDTEVDDEVEEISLKQVAAEACKRFDIGSAVQPKPLFSSDTPPNQQGYESDEQVLAMSSASPLPTRYARVLEREFNAVVIEHHLKWAPLCVSEPGPLPGEVVSDRLGRYDFHLADAMVDWAVARKMNVKGHVLVWHVTSPQKVLEELSPAQVKTELRRHIFTTMGHFRGRVQVWDVVNEALAPDGTLAQNIFYQKIGPEYIELAFRWAHQADPDAILLYNDNKVEGIGTDKSQGFYELLADLVAKDVPIHGCGMQAHFNAAGVGRNRCPTPRMVKHQIRRLGQLGLTVNLSEMDVRVSELPANVRDMAQRQVYHDIIAAALSEPAFNGVWLWGFTDRHTWVTHFYYDDEPLIFDEDYSHKEAFYGVRDALESLTPKGRVGGEGVLLDSDFDVDGKQWGHLWMQPEPGMADLAEPETDEGDARPDWERADEVAVEETMNSEELQVTSEAKELPPIL